MKVKFWGTRGSIPTPSTRDFSTVEYGGNTPCIEVVSACGDEYILDIGSGARPLGIDLMKRHSGKVKAKVLVSHPHYDHIQGFPFFVPAFSPNCELDLYCGDDTLFELRKQNESSDTKIMKRSLETATKDTVVMPMSGRKNVTSEIFGGQQNQRNFPVPIEGMLGIKSFTDLKPGRAINQIGVEISYLRHHAHPNGMYSFKLSEGCEHVAPINIVYTGDYESDNLGPNDEAMIKWVDEAELLIADAQYTKDEYNGIGCMPKKTWGHSTPERICKLASKANVRRLIITHHDPLHDDYAVARMEAAAMEYMHEELGRKHIQVDFAKEGMEIEI